MPPSCCSGVENGSAIIIMRYIVMEKTRICLLRVYFLTGTELKA